MNVCPKCKKSVQNHFKYCTNCGTKIKTISDRTFLFIILIIIIAISFSPLILKYSSNKPKKLTKLDIENYIEKLERKELLIKIDVVNNKAYVSLMVWNLFAKNQKEEISQNLAVYCLYKKGSDYNFISVLDVKTNRVLAVYDIKGRFKIFR